MRRYKVEYLPEAKRDIEDIRDYISEGLENSVAATRIVRAIVEKCESLSAFPNGSSVRFYSGGQGIRFVHYGNYTIAYFVEEDGLVVDIVAVKYSRMDLETAIK